MRIEWDTAVGRACPWCLATPGEGCRILQGNRASRVETYPDGRPAAAHVLRALVWEPEDMAIACDYCGVPADEPCRTVPRGYGPSIAARGPHPVRRARSRLAESRSGLVVHVRDAEHPGRSLCRVTVRPHPSAGEPTCRTCRQHERHAAELSRRRAITEELVARSGA